MPRPHNASRHPWNRAPGDIAYAKPLVLRYDPATRQLWAAGPAAFRTKR